MCEVLDRIEKSGEQRGLEQGREQGIEQGIAKGIEQMILRMQKNGYSIKQRSKDREVGEECGKRSVG